MAMENMTGVMVAQKTDKSKLIQQEACVGLFFSLSVAAFDTFAFNMCVA